MHSESVVNDDCLETVQDEDDDDYDQVSMPAM